MIHFYFDWRHTRINVTQTYLKMEIRKCCKKRHVCKRVQPLSTLWMTWHILSGHSCGCKLIIDTNSKWVSNRQADARCFWVTENGKAWAWWLSGLSMVTIVAWAWWLSWQEFCTSPLLQNCGHSLALGAFLFFFFFFIYFTIYTWPEKTNVSINLQWNVWLMVGW